MTSSTRAASSLRDAASQVQLRGGGSPANLLFIESSSGFGGSTVGLARLVAGLDRERFTPHVVVAHPTQREFLIRSGVVGPGTGVDCEIVPVPSPRLPMLSRVDLAWRTLSYIRRLHRFAAGRDIGLVHVNNSVSINMAGILLSRWLRVPVVVKQRGFEWASPVNRRLAAMVDWYVPDSDAVCGALVDLGASRDQMTVTYCTVDLAKYEVSEDPAAIRRELGLPGDAPLVGIIGCLVDWKGQGVFLEAMHRVLQRHPGARALVVGDTPDGEPSEFSKGLTTTAERLGIADRVLFTGHRDDVPRMLRSLDVFVHASTSPEPFGTVIAEAMATRVPVIAARAGGPPEYVLHGETGLLHEPGDAEDLATAIQTLLEEPKAAQRLAAAGHDHVAARFGLQTHVDAHEAVYSAVLAADADRA